MNKYYTHSFGLGICSVVFSSTDSDLIVFGCENGHISLFSTKSNENVWTNRDFVGSSIISVDISSNDNIVAGGGYMNFLYVMNAANGKTICSVDVGSPIHRVLFLSRQKIACGLLNGTVAIICWKMQKIEKILKICEHFMYSSALTLVKNAVYALAISPVNNDILLTGNHFGVIKHVTISSEKTVMVFEGHTEVVMDLSFLSCGTMFVSCSWDQTVRLFALDQKQSIRAFKGHSLPIRSVSLIHDDELLITTSYDNIVKVWKMESGECLSTVKAEHSVWCVAVSKNDKSLVVGGCQGILTIVHVPPRPAVSLDRNLRLQR